ncbi:hypothetical protein NDU88_003837 [Pleurodeles waltl]|uniref:Uncharacterized protein n=1 Tax=Pleurodeles waltl TaxID=8319 RepID=A0AAV7NL08_PLEWA|nr:hypothetical protein NDU88_003837 [Pleurodeles waltl]
MIIEYKHTSLGRDLPLPYSRQDEETTTEPCYTRSQTAGLIGILPQPARSCVEIRARHRGRASPQAALKDPCAPGRLFAGKRVHSGEPDTDWSGIHARHGPAGSSAD